MAWIRPLEDCNFSAEVTDKGMFVGRVREFPDLRSRPQSKKIDALDEIITITRDKIARLAEAAAGFKAER